MRLGIVGLGRVGRMHATHLATTAGVEEVMLLGRDAGRLEDARREISRAAEAARGNGGDDGAIRRAAGCSAASVSTSLDLPGALPQLDGLVIATPTDTHVELVLQAVRARIPVLVEKPLALDADEIRRVADEADASSTPVMVAFHRRYDEGHQDLRRLVKNGALGTIRTVHGVDHDHPQVPFEYVPGSGGIFRDMLIHDLDIVPWVLGEQPVSLYAVGGVVEEPEFRRLGDHDTVTVVLTMASGAQVTLTAGRRLGTGQDVRLTVYGTEGTAAAGLDDATPVRSTQPGAAAPGAGYDSFVERFLPAFRREVEHFVGLVRGERENLTPPRAGLPAMHLAEKALESVRTGRPVEIEDVHEQQ